ncbi:hypothetical protein [Stackebrandtia soli]|uniref:hypothetical protein n=1 Tax=Stackebrandtia soli TaxID=1892856 RepID=UPI0039EAEB7F
MDVHGYLTDYSNDLVFGTDDPATVIDRYHAPGFDMTVDGRVWSRERLIAHAHPVRRNTVSAEVVVRRTLVTGRDFAAVHDLRATTRAGHEVNISVLSLGRIAEDGRIARINQTQLPEST